MELCQFLYFGKHNPDAFAPVRTQALFEFYYSGQPNSKLFQFYLNPLQDLSTFIFSTFIFAQKMEKSKNIPVRPNRILRDIFVFDMNF